MISTFAPSSALLLTLLFFSGAGSAAIEGPKATAKSWGRCRDAREGRDKRQCRNGVPVAPKAPTGVLGSVDDTMSSVTFDAVPNGGSPITGYTVTSNPGGFTATGLSSPLVVTGLTNGTSYTFTVTATNAIGTSPASTASATVVPLPFIQVLPAGVPGGSEAAGTFTAARGGTISFTRNSTKWCLNGSGVHVSLSNSVPCLETQGADLEAAATNNLLHARDGTQAAAWALTNCTASKTATGTGGVANAATILTATGANATMLQARTLAAATRTYSVWLKRRTGSGNIQLTRNGGSTWTTVTITGSWAPYSITSSVTNPSCGVRVVTSGDEVDVDHNQDEVGAIRTSPVDTAGTTATRTLDISSMANPISGNTGGNLCMRVSVPEPVYASNAIARGLMNMGTYNAANSASLYLNAAGLPRFEVISALGNGSGGGMKWVQGTVAVSAGAAVEACTTSAGALSVKINGVAQSVTSGTSNGTDGQPGTGIISTMPSTVFLGILATNVSAHNGHLYNFCFSRKACP